MRWIRRRWRTLTPRGKRVVGFLALGGFLGFVVVLGVIYAAATIPLPSRFDNAQTTVLTYADGSTMANLAKENRTDIPLASVPRPVRDAVLAAEDRGYYHHPGISITGIARAAFQDVFGHGAKQGGSTITQQYARNAYLTQHRTFARKFREAVIAVKLDRKYSKDQVLEWYLNTIYFGRGAYGIEAASRTYFGIPASRLSVAQGAVLAALIRSPEGGDPAIAPNTARRRWDAVLDGMVRMKVMTRADVAAVRYPSIKPRRAKGASRGSMGYVVDAVRLELKAKGFSDDEIYRGGLRIVTTISRTRQDAAVAAVEGVLDDPAHDPHAALVAVEPGTGKIVALYGGRDYGGPGDKSYVDYVTNPRQPGSSFKPFVLAAALDDGISLRSTYDGHSPQFVGSYRVDNFGGEQFGRIDLVAATAHSVNTVYVPLGVRVGFTKTMRTVHDLGVPDTVTCDANHDATLYLGTCDLTPLQEAGAYATLAAKGKAVTPYLVAEVRSRAGKRLYTASPRTGPGVSEAVAADATYAMQHVLTEGTARGAQLGRPAAGKTGTTSDNTNAWFTGFVPQLAASVWMGYEPVRDVSGTATTPPLRRLHGVREVTGGTLPAKIWKAFMTAALQGVPVEQLPPPAFGGTGVTGSPPATPSPTATPTATASGSAVPSGTPTFVVPTGLPSGSNSPSPSPSPSGSPSSSPSASPSGQPSGGSHSPFP